MGEEQPYFALGVRAEPRSLHWAVVEGTQTAPIIKAHDKADAPAAFDEPAALAWFRSRMLHLIDTYHPVAVGVRYPEPAGRGGNRDSARERSRVEGIVLEAAHSRGLPVLTGALATISKQLGTKKAKRYIDDGDLRGLDLTSLPVPRREAVLVGVAQLPVGSPEQASE
jgi:hypothetical protein